MTAMLLVNLTMTYLFISALDPAGPLFHESEVRLREDDAEFVDVIHTNSGPASSGKLGIDRNVGHIDFYPNGGSKQPACSFWCKLEL